MQKKTPNSAFRPLEGSFMKFNLTTWVRGENIYWKRYILDEVLGQDRVVMEIELKVSYAYKANALSLV